MLRPDSDWIILVVVVLWLVTLTCYWWQRRLQPQAVGLAVVVAMVTIGAVLGTASLARCRDGQTRTNVVGWVLNLYLGNPPQGYPNAACPDRLPPLALQFGSTVCLSATLVGALAAAAVLWRQPVGRLRARLVRDATVFTGLDTMTISLLRRLAETGRPGSIVVIEPDASHPLLAEARATGVRIMIADPTATEVLLPVLTGRGSCALSYLYALRQDVVQNEAVLAAANVILASYQPDPQRQPHLLARIDDPRHADHWRGLHSGTSARWFEDALSAQESSAYGVANQIAKSEARQLLLCGDSTLALAILLELARRGWECLGLVAAQARGRAAHPDAAWLDDAQWQAPAPHPVERVLLLDQRADDLRREYLATAPPSVAKALPVVRARPNAWKDHLLAMLDGMSPAEARRTVVVVADASTDASSHEAGRVARLHPGIPIFVLSSDGAGANKIIFDSLQPFQRTLLVGGEAPEDSWTRIARHWHECYRLAHPAAPGDARAPAGRPWADLDEFLRQDNILQLRSIMAAVVTQGRRWVPARAVPAGSYIELTDGQLGAVACAEHTRWYERRRTAGWRAAVGERGGGSALVNSGVVPWTDLPVAGRASRTDYLRSQLEQLEEVGFMPIVPRGGPPEAAHFLRVGVVRAKPLHARWPWPRRSGDTLRGDIGDWRVVDEFGDERTVRDPEFLASHQPIAGDRWSRTGTFRAWRVGNDLVLRTMEGRATARPGDWVVEGCHGERWPVAHEQFLRSYRASPQLDKAEGSADKGDAIA